jgi:cytochrome c553
MKERPAGEDINRIADYLWRKQQKAKNALRQTKKIFSTGNEVSVALTDLFLPSAAVLLAAALLVAATAAQSPAPPPDAAAPPPAPARVYPAPTNLKVLPKELTGQQVHQIMEQWSAALGTHCNACHLEDRANLGPNGRPRLDFADDSKAMKASARVMFAMTEKINTEFVTKIDSSGIAVTCGTCHRGHLGPEPFIIQPSDGPPAAQLSPDEKEKPPVQ